MYNVILYDIPYEGIMELKILINWTFHNVINYDAYNILILYNIL